MAKWVTTVRLSRKPESTQRIVESSLLVLAMAVTKCFVRRLPKLVAALAALLQTVAVT